MNEPPLVRRPLSSRDTRWAKAAAQWLAASGLRPNHISVLSFVFACLAGLSLLGAPGADLPARGLLFLAAAAFMQMRLLCNLFDGMVAVEGGFKTKSGEIYNELPDRFSDAVILVAAGYATPGTEALHALGWLAAVLSILTAYVRALGASAGASQCFAGPMAKPQRMALLTGICVLSGVLAFLGKSPDLLHPALAIVGVGCLLTIMRRVLRIVRELEAK